MIRVRKARERGHFDHGWLDTWHTFSFDQYWDPEHMGFRVLRVINDDRVAPGRGFPTHGHRDMEIITWVLDGSLEHRDSMGNGSIIKPGEAQRMTAGSGVTHSEFNPSKEGLLRLLQIWILPDRRGLPPGYEQKHFPEAEREGRLRLIASPDGRDGSVTIHQDAKVYAALLAAGQTIHFDAEPTRGLWLQVARGCVLAGGHELAEGDGLAVEGERQLEMQGIDRSEVLLFDLA
jgi:quercetin 2,3-dioxygenase